MSVLVNYNAEDYTRPSRQTYPWTFIRISRHIRSEVLHTSACCRNALPITQQGGQQ